MKLMDILNEVETLTEGRKANKSKKAKIQKNFGNKLSASKKFASKLKARRGKINWTDESEFYRNEIISAYMVNEPEQIISKMAGVNGFKYIDVLKALETGHGDYKKLIKKAGNKKSFFEKLFVYIKGLDTD